MVSLINHEYSRREAHGRFAWQFMLANAKAEKREAAFSSRWLAVRDYDVLVDATSAG